MMDDGYVRIEDVEWRGNAENRKWFRIRSALQWSSGVTCIIPVFAVHEDSEIWLHSAMGDKGTLILRTDIAEEKGLIPGGTGRTGGIPLKRNKMPDPPELMSDAELGDVKSRVSELVRDHDAHGWGFRAGGEVGFAGNTSLLASDQKLAQLIAWLPRDAGALLQEVDALRAWKDEAIKAFNARRRKR